MKSEEIHRRENELVQIIEHQVEGMRDPEEIRRKLGETVIGLVEKLGESVDEIKYEMRVDSFDILSAHYVSTAYGIVAEQKGVSADLDVLKRICDTYYKFYRLCSANNGIIATRNRWLIDRTLGEQYLWLTRDMDREDVLANQEAVELLNHMKREGHISIRTKEALVRQGFMAKKEIVDSDFFRLMKGANIRHSFEHPDPRWGELVEFVSAAKYGKGPYESIEFCYRVECLDQEKGIIRLTTYEWLSERGE